MAHRSSRGSVGTSTPADGHAGGGVRLLGVSLRRRRPGLSDLGALTPSLSTVAAGLLHE